jgi:hypothetical protein
MPSTPARATSSALRIIAPESALPQPPSMPARSAHSLSVGPGHSAVTDTPVSDSSAWTASDSVCTKAFVAA